MGLPVRVIIHIDLDAFFASVEMREHPEIAHDPVVIGADPKSGNGRGVVATCNYKAREFGICSAMPISTAYKRCPNAVFLPVNMLLYKRVSERIMTILQSFADEFEQVSIDEAFLDVSVQCLEMDTAAQLAKKIKNAIWHSEMLTCSIGIAPNKTVAKIASEQQKPDGITVVKHSDVKNFLFPLPIRRLPGIGPKTEERLLTFGIMTIDQLAKVPEHYLVTEFGVWGTRLHYLANGVDDSLVQANQGLKSVSRFHTFERDLGDTKEVEQKLDLLCEKAHKEILHNNLKTRTVGIKIRFEDFETHTKERSRKYAYKNCAEIKQVIHELIQGFTKSKKKIRLIGVCFANLENADTGQRRVDEFF